jgi:hypothetical protein
MFADTEKENKGTVSLAETSNFVPLCLSPLTSGKIVNYVCEKITATGE